MLSRRLKCRPSVTTRVIMTHDDRTASFVRAEVFVLVDIKTFFALNGWCSWVCSHRHVCGFA